MAYKDGDIERLRERIEESDEIVEADRELLIDFSDRLWLLKSTYSDARHKMLLEFGFRMARAAGPIHTSLEDREEAERIVRWIHKTYDNEDSNRNYRAALRVLGKRVGDDDEVPESLDWISSTTSSSYDPSPDPGQMLHWDDDVKPMIDETMNARDAALIAVAWDSGCRSGELHDLRVGDVSDHRHGLQVHVDGKRGERTVMLIPSVPYLKRWLEDHPRSDDATAPLWCKLRQGAGEQTSYDAFLKVPKTAAERAGVTKDVDYRNFRRSSASYLASQGVNQAVLEDHHGWRRGSSVAAHYIAVFSNKRDDALAEAHGLEVDKADTGGDLAPLECPRCGRETPRDEEFCVWCHQAIEPGAVESLREQERELRQSVLRLIREDPSLVDDIERYQDLMTVLDERPDLHADAEAFRDALDE